MGERLKGTCLCGACTFTAIPGTEAGVCHCGMCRRWTGGMFIVAECGDSLEFDADIPLVRYSSSEWGERAFCGKCGSSIAWLAKDGSLAVVSIQAFEDPSRFKITSQICIDRKPDNYALANETATMTEAELFAKFAPSTESDA